MFSRQASHNETLLDCSCLAKLVLIKIPSVVKVISVSKSKYRIMALAEFSIDVIVLRFTVQPSACFLLKFVLFLLGCQHL